MAARGSRGADGVLEVSDYLKTVGKSSGLFYTHVYETEGFMLKIDGSVPKTVADEYNKVFQQQV